MVLSRIRKFLSEFLNGRGKGLEELASLLDIEKRVLLDPTIRKYRWFRIPKRTGGRRLVYAPGSELKKVQRRMHRRLMGRLKVHPSAKGFRKGESIVTHARLHACSEVVVKMDIIDFFPSTRESRVYEYFRVIGWNRPAAKAITRLTTHKGSTRYYASLPQGAPTSPVLSNAINYAMDQRLSRLAVKSGAVYSRYADDLTFSFANDNRPYIMGVLRRVRKILGEYGYRVHGRKKLRVMRRHQSQRITGLVVNDKVQLPRELRRKLRAIEHHHRTCRPSTMTPEQLAGWRAFQAMIERQSSSG